MERKDPHQEMKRKMIPIAPEGAYPGWKIVGYSEFTKNEPAFVELALPETDQEKDWYKYFPEVKPTNLCAICGRILVSYFVNNKELAGPPLIENFLGGCGVCIDCAEEA